MKTEVVVYDKPDETLAWAKAAVWCDGIFRDHAQMRLVDMYRYHDGYSVTYRYTFEVT